MKRKIVVSLLTNRVHPTRENIAIRAARPSCGRPSPIILAPRAASPPTAATRSGLDYAEVGMKMQRLLLALLCSSAVSVLAQTTDELNNDGRNTDNVTTQSMGYHRRSYSPLKQINDELFLTPGVDRAREM